MRSSILAAVAALTIAQAIPAGAQMAVTGTPSSADHRYTVDDIRNIAIGNTMAQVREAFGPPSVVSTLSGLHLSIWCYFGDKLHVYDTDSGTAATLTNITFSTVTKRATKVEF